MSNKKVDLTEQDNSTLIEMNPVYQAKLDTRCKEFSCVINCPNQYQEIYWKTSCIQKCLSKLNALGYVYAGIFHDKDVKENSCTGELKRIHFHLVIRTTSPIRIGTIINRLCEFANVSPDCVSVEKAIDFLVAVQYLTHKNDQTKYQYSIENVETNLSRDALLEYFVRSKKEEVTFSLLWTLIVDKGLDNVQIMAIIGLNRYIQVRGCIDEIRHCAFVKDKEYRDRIKVLSGGSENETIQIN